ncbi:peptidylprolyl isomerase [Sulfurimonas sp. HSL-1716]|uniref:peptidylprolyl isomerase n=1 Tax=Hydrocurvibacter sulfurireducens TaxID=3131937 RepID=UPI0031F849FA
MKKILLSLLLSFSYLMAGNPIAVLQTTQGNIELELYPDAAPKAVENFMTHIKEGYYDHVAFHRIIRDFMIQGGDPTETGRGGESIWKKPFKDEFKPGYAFDDAGVLAMANAGPNTNGSQFFITTARTSWLNGHHTIFGHVVGSMDALMKLNKVPTSGRYGGDRPLERQEIIKAYIKK